ncbi:MAG: RHS repeat-associated core domain-containing protein [Pirellulaceae bacterium]|nr:RHS repeat-associated core domain-containing protein [Pirellulaceae bacterium]
MVGADHAIGGQTDETYGYDLNGNRNTSGYTTSTNNRTTADPGFTYTYDDQGNRTSRTETSTGKVTEYTWDHRNRLVTVKDRNTAGGSVVKQVDYAYDAFNRLVKRTYDADGAGSGAATNQFWVYDEGINAVLQFDGSSASNLSHRYLWSDRVDELLADETVGSGADTLYALGDHLGTIRDIANFNESTSVTSVTNHRTYNSFGKLVSETNAAVDLIFGYTGKQLDEATGLQHNLFRWYDSGLGQWMSEDLLGFAGGDSNLKRYVDNATANALDLTGLKKGAKLDQLGEMLKAISKSQEAVQEASRLSAIINHTFELNRKWNWAAFSIFNQKVKGYYCYEWAWAFKNAYDYVQCRSFTVEMHAVGDFASGSVHAYVKITSVETGKFVYVDDGFGLTGGGQVHTTPPIGGIYKSPMQFTDELAEVKCDVPPVISEEAYAQFMRMATSAMDASMH